MYYMSNIPHPKVSLIFKLLIGLGVEGIEKSFKMSSESLLENRFIIAIHQPNKNQRQIINSCHKMGMPETCLESFKNYLPKANLVYFGLEEQAEYCVYKVYLEFWSQYLHKRSTIPGYNQHVTLHIGYKWNAEDNTQNTIARYTLHPDLSLDQILQRVTNIYQDHPDTNACTIAKKIININAKVEGSLFNFLEVEEEKNPRKSFDINLYEAGLLMNDIHDELRQAQIFYNISDDRFNALYQNIQHKKFGHLSGGIDKFDNDFMTFYYEVDRL